MTIILLTHRLVRLVIAALVVAATTAVSAQELGTTYEVVSSFDIVFKNGRAPSSLRQDSDGTFYGTTSGGGLFDKGLLFRMDATGVVTPLQSFSDAEGARPFGLVRASDGRFYGLTSEGGSVRVRYGFQVHAGRCVGDGACVLSDRQLAGGFVCRKRRKRLRVDGAVEAISGTARSS